MEYDFRRIEKDWQKKWKESSAYKVENDLSKPKCYVLDMFPYPSGAGLHVGHPLGYIASDIYSRYKRLKGFNVLHPMGFDSFGLPAEQYALDTGQHPAMTTQKNISTFKSQLDNIGFCYDWSREVQTSDPNYYKWTQWIFLQLFNSYFCNTEKKALPISLLIKKYETKGAMPKSGEPVPGKHFTAEQWKAFSEKEKADILMKRRLAYCGYGEVNWCEALGTVLANDEVVNGVSERGGHPVVKKTLRQWYLRITAYADRLLDGLNTVDFSEAMKEMQSNWIGRSEGAEIDFEIRPPLTPPGGEDTAPRYQTADPSIYRLTKELAKNHRENPTSEEEILWELLRGDKTGFHIRRQHIIGNYIVDFACLDKLTVIEIDGGYHNNPEVQEYDKNRSRFLKEKGFTELRYTNEEVKKDPQAVVKNITEKLSALQSVPKKNRPSGENIDENSQVLSSGEDLGGISQVLPLGEDLGGAVVLRVYTTRPDTIFGVDFMVVAPEHELIEKITTAEQKAAVEEYILYVKSRSERERMAEKKITGVFTGAYALNPFDGRQIPVWISEYVLAGYGTGAIMAVPCGDERDHKFANHFNIPITNIIGSHYNGEEANPTKEAVLENSSFLDGMVMKGAGDVVIKALEEKGIGVRKVNYKMRDAAFSRQRYWGEPFPITWKDGIAYALPESEMPVTLPEVQSYTPGPNGEGPLANLPAWFNQFESEGRGVLETNTMPGYAGSSWYFLRYMDPKNEKEFCDRTISDYWNQVDLYIGGTEHAVGHLLYSRMWTKVLFDLGLIGFDEPYKRLVNQGMIQGSSRFVYRVHGKNQFVSAGLKDRYSTDRIHVDVNIVDGVELDIVSFKKWKNGEFENAEFILEDGKYICGTEVEKMSKSKFNTVNPDDLVARYGADTFRMYEMFLGPVEMSKPWDTKGIEGVHRFLRKFWRLFFVDTPSLGGGAGEARDTPSLGGGRGEAFIVTNDDPTAAELKVLHHTIKRIGQDTERFSFNTGVSGFMIATNELTDLDCHKRKILEPLLILLVPYAPHIAEELWHVLGNESSILSAAYPVFEEKYVIETSKEYPVSVNGKLRTNMNVSLDASQADVEKLVLENLVVQKWLEGKNPKKIIYVKNKMINVVI